MPKKQQELKGFERPNGIPEVDAAAERFKASSKKRKRAQDAEIEARDILEHLMKTNKLTVYEDLDAGLLVTINTTEKVKVEELGEKAEPEDDDEGDADESPGKLSKLEQKAAKKSPDAAA